MRDKQDILEDVHENIQRVPHEGQQMLLYQYYFIEVLLDIRNELTALTTILGSVEKIAYRAG